MSVYTYLTDGTAYTAEALNSRLESVRDSLNSLESSAFAHGAFRHEHLPQLIGPSGREAGVFDAFQSHVGIGFDSSSSVRLMGTASVPVTRIDYPAGIDMAADNVTAFIILANFTIRRFLDDGDTEIPIERAYEDFIGTKFTVMATEEDGTAQMVPHSARAISPGWTMANATMPAAHSGENNYYWPGQAITPDRNNTFKDLAIRTIVLAEDIEAYGMDRVYGFTISASTRYLTSTPSGLGDPGVELTKRNLTVIPIHAEVRRVS